MSRLVTALEEDEVTGYGSGGGFWHLLAFYRKLALVEDAKIEDVGTAGEDDNDRDRDEARSSILVAILACQTVALLSSRVQQNPNTTQRQALPGCSREADFP